MRTGSTEPARSTWAMIQPPKMSPLALASDGIGITRSTSSLSLGSEVRGSVGALWLIGMLSAGEACIVGQRVFPVLASPLAAHARSSLE